MLNASIEMNVNDHFCTCCLFKYFLFFIFGIFGWVPIWCSASIALMMFGISDFGQNHCIRKIWCPIGLPTHQLKFNILNYEFLCLAWLTNRAMLHMFGKKVCGHKPTEPNWAFAEWIAKFSLGRRKKIGDFFLIWEIIQYQFFMNL